MSQGGIRGMQVKQHAVRRYKQRIGCRTASRERIVRKINKEIERNTIHRQYYRDGYYAIYTTKFIAKCKNNIIVTILPPACKETKYGA